MSKIETLPAEDRLQLAGRIDAAIRGLNDVYVESDADRMDINAAIALLAELNGLVDPRGGK